MKVAFGAPRVVAGGNGPVPRAVADASPGALDFAAVMDARGSLDRSGSMGAATRFDEGPMFGHAVAAPRATMRGRAEVRPVEQDAAEARRSSPPPSGTAVPSDRRSPRGVAPPHDRAATDPVAPRDPRSAAMRAAVGTGIATSSPRERAVPATVAAAAGRSADRGGRARFVDELAPVHVVVRATEEGVRLIARVGGIEADGSASVARALEDAVSADGRRLASLRLNGRDRGSRGGEEEHG
ncbi:hypothetical protein [Sphingomonas adhaesiva]|uniref:hypothetical protein n=1 Tax=Sphingomonas adhaesiva TaxID=28212 RepID=UPI002FF8697F